MRNLGRWLSLAAVLSLLLTTTTGVALAQGGTIAGTVTAPSGYPLPAGTRVKLFEPGNWETFGQAVADVNTGAFSLGPVPNGLYVLKAVPPSGSGYAHSAVTRVSVFNAPVDVGTVALTAPDVIGTVTAPDGSTPVDAEVRVYAGDGTLVQWLQAPGGAFLVGGLPVGTYGMRASPLTDDPYWHSPVEMVTLGGAAEVATLTLTTADLYGIAEDAQGNPVLDATVYATLIDVASAGAAAVEMSAMDVRNLEGGRLQQRDRTHADGAYAIGGLITGTYVLTARPPWYEAGLLPPDPITVTLPGATPPYTLTFRAPPKVVTGTVETNTGVAVADARIVAHRLDKHGRTQTLSGPDGAYVLRLSEGTWALTVKPISATLPSEWVYPDPPQLIHFRHNLELEQKRTDFTVLTADAQVTGEVALPDGAATDPLSVTVALHNDEGIGRRTVVTITGGTTTTPFDLVIPNGGYKVWVTPHDAGLMGPVVDPIQVPPNGVTDLGTLTLLTRDARITGTVTEAGGAGVVGVPVSAWRPGAPGGAKATTGPDGRYILSVVAGTWHVQPSPGPDQPYLYTDSGARVTLSATETVSDVDVSLVPADAMLEGVLVDETGHPVTGAEGWVGAINTITPTLHTGAPIEAGAFQIAVPGGTYRVTAHLPAGSSFMSTGERDVTVADGAATVMTLTVKTKDARIIGALWDPRSQDVVEGVDAGVAAWAGANWTRMAVDPGNGAFSMDVASGLWHLGYRVDRHSGYVGLDPHKHVPVASGQTVPVPLQVAKRDGVITGTVLGADGAPLAGAKVIADGVGPQVADLWLTTRSGGDGRFSLRVPYGDYHLGATTGLTGTINPALRRVSVPVGGISGGHSLQFRHPDAVLSGTLIVTHTTGVTGTALVWAWSEDDAFVRTRVPVTNSVGSYELDVISNTTWHVGAVYETPSQYGSARETVVLTEGGAIQDLVLNGPYPKPAPMAVTFDASQPQRIVLEDGTSIDIPGGAMPVAGQVTLRIVPLAAVPHQRHANIHKYGYAFTAVDAQGEPITEHFNQEVVIGFAYDAWDLWRQGIYESLLAPAYFSTTTSRWTVPESYVVDIEANRVVMQIDHFTDFALTRAPGYRLFLPMLLR